MTGAPVSTDKAPSTDQIASASRSKIRQRAALTRKPRLSRVIGAQILIVIAVLAAWEYLPKIGWLSSRFRFFDPFFISSPTEVVQRLGVLFTGPANQRIWPYLWPTVGASVLGLLIGLVIGGVAGLLLGSSPYASAVLRPFVVLVNSVPRIALIPVIVIIFGTNFTSDVIVSVAVVVFIVFFNAYEGAQSPPAAMIQNTALLGATRFQIMTRIRLPYAYVWTLAALPAAAGFSVVAVVTGEILTGYAGLGQLISNAISTADATLTFAVIVVLAVVGLAITAIAEIVKRRTLHWWTGGRS
jgi:NitT/TauT family transport system permease protein